MTTRVAAFLK